VAFEIKDKVDLRKPNRIEDSKAKNWSSVNKFNQPPDNSSSPWSVNRTHVRNP
jgi:hypothetical protein